MRDYGVQGVVMGWSKQWWGGPSLLLLIIVSMKSYLQKERYGFASAWAQAILDSLSSWPWFLRRSGAKRRAIVVLNCPSTKWASPDSDLFAHSRCRGQTVESWGIVRGRNMSACFQFTRAQVGRRYEFCPEEIKKFDVFINSAEVNLATY